MNMTYDDYDRLTEELLKIENSDPGWLPEKKDVDERLDMSREDDVIFLLWLSLTVAGAVNPEAAAKRQAVLRKLYDTVILTD